MTVNGLALLTTIVFILVTGWVCWHSGVRHGEDRARRRYRVKRQMDNIRRASVRSPW